MGAGLKVGWPVFLTSVMAVGVGSPWAEAGGGMATTREATSTATEKAASSRRGLKPVNVRINVDRRRRTANPLPGGVQTCFPLTLPLDS